MAWQEDLATELQQAVNGEKDRVIARYQQVTGKSAQTLYRIAAKHGYDSGRAPRRDKGRTEVTDQQLHFVMGLITTSARERKGPIMPVERALEIAHDNDIIERGTISARRLQALLRERSMHAAALKAGDPKQPMRSLYPNHVHQVDASVCIQYYLRPGQPMKILPENIFYKNKFENFAKVKQKIIRWTLTDHYSGTIFVKYYQSKGERQADLYDFLLSAWSGGKHEKLPFRGVPEILMMDAGSANMSRAIREFLGRLDILMPESLPENPSRDGSVEKAQDLVERWFESSLKFQPAHSIEDLNSWATDWAAWYNATRVHTRHGRTRTGCWLTIKPEQLKELPESEILHDLFANPEEERLVNQQYAISFRGNRYDVRCIAGVIPAHTKVKVILRPFLWPQVAVAFGGTEYLVKPIDMVEGGFRADAAVIGEQYKSMPETVTQQAVKRADNLAYGDDPARDAVPFGGLTVFGHQSDKVRHDYLPRAGTPHRISRQDIAVRALPLVEVLRRLSGQIGPVPPALNRQIRAAYGASIPEDEAERIIAEIVSAGTFTPPNEPALQEGAC